ncbi:MAG: hypothetical protein ACYCW6_24280 [Candidatus Xenobia bacterium]
MKRVAVPLLILVFLAVTGAAVERMRARERSVLSGYFENQPTSIASRASGRVRRIVANEGTAVHQGDVLLELEAVPGEADANALQDAAQQAWAHFEELRAGPRPAEIAAARARYEEARARYERVGALGTLPDSVAEASSVLNVVAFVLFCGVIVTMIARREPSLEVPPGYPVLGEMQVGPLLACFPQVATVLQERGLVEGGRLTLRQACRLRNLDLDALLADLNLVCRTKA